MAWRRGIRSRVLASSLAAATIWFAARAEGADIAAPQSTATSTAPSFEWTGWYFGSHGGYATGNSQWTATEAGASTPPLSGSLELFNPFNSFAADGSYFLGLQAGFNQKFGSRFVLGVEADVSFPALPVGLVGRRTIASDFIGQASYQDTVAYTGTARARAGYLLENNWLIYATGGLAFGYDKLLQTQIAGVPAGRTATPGDERQARLSRLGWTVGAGFEWPVAPHWTAKVEYQYASFGEGAASFVQAAQRFDSNLWVQSLRLGFNYQIGETYNWGSFLANGATPILEDRFNLHAQTTYVGQYAPRFRSPYIGPQSFLPRQGQETADATFYLGVRLWEGAEFWVNPEIDQGFGLSGTFGVAGFPSAEAYKLGNDTPYARLHRAFIRQTVDLSGQVEKVEAGINQFAGSNTSNRLVITIGKVSVSDMFDENRYAHDPRGDFLNWALVDTGTFDYAADAWGYTYGALGEWFQGAWTLRAGIFDAPIVPNNPELDPRFGQFQSVFEIEHRHQLGDQPGKIAVTGWLTRARLGNYNDAVLLAQLTGQAADITAVRRYTSRSGVSANMEQQITSYLGIFLRTGFASPNIEPDAFTDIDRTIAGGAALSGKLWGRPDDVWGVAGIINNISTSHQTFLNNGGLGILVGDGQLPRPGLERIVETYYRFPFYGWRVTLDYQFINNPGYNRDRGPASVIGTRFHMQF